MEVRALTWVTRTFKSNEFNYNCISIFFLFFSFSIFFLFFFFSFFSVWSALKICLMWPHDEPYSSYTTTTAIELLLENNTKYLLVRDKLVIFFKHVWLFLQWDNLKKTLELIHSSIIFFSQWEEKKLWKWFIV